MSTATRSFSQGVSLGTVQSAPRMNLAGAAATTLVTAWRMAAVSPVAITPFRSSPPMKGRPKQLGGLGGAQGAVAQLQAAVDHVPGVVQEGRQVGVFGHIVADVEDVEGARLDLVPDGQVGGLDVLREETRVGQTGGLPALGGGIEAIHAHLLAAAGQVQDVFRHDRQPLGHGVGILVEMRHQHLLPSQAHRPHEGRVERQDDQRFAAGRLDQPFDDLHGLSRATLRG